MGTVSQLKKENFQRVLEILVNNPDGSTRPELAGKAKLTNTTVQRIIGDLAEKHIVKVEGLAVSIGGRKAQRFALNPGYRYLVAVQLRVNKVNIGLFDYNVNMLESRTESIDLGSNSIERTMRLIASEIKEMLSQKEIPIEKVAGVGFSIPGPVDFKHGRVITIGGFPMWRNIALKERMEKLLDVPVYIEKDVNSSVMFLKRSKSSVLLPNILYIALEDGVGSALMMNGVVYRSSHGIAGEIGHMMLSNNTLRCSCGNVGCLETVISDFAIIDQVRKEKKLPPTQPLTMKDVVRLDSEDDPVVKRILKDVVAIFATIVHDTILMYDPDEIYINCLWMQKNQEYYLDLLSALQANRTQLLSNDLAISMIDIADFGLRSAATVVAVQEIEGSESSIFKELGF